MKLKEGFILQNIDDTAVALPPQNTNVKNAMISLNKTGLFLWDILEQGASEEQLVEALANRYGIDIATAEADVADFIATCKKNGFLDE